MSFWNSLKRLFGGQDKTPATRPPHPGLASARETTDNTPNPPPRSAVYRDEIIDGRPRIAGYRFRVDTTADSAHDIVAALLADNLPAFAQRRLAIVPIKAANWHGPDYRPLISPNTVFLIEAPGPDDEVAPWLAQLRSIQAAGARIGLSRASVEHCPEAMPLASLIVADFCHASFEALERWAQQFSAAHPAIEIAADGVGAWAEHRLCQSLGFRYSLGGFAAEPDTASQGEMISQSRMVLMDMLNLVRRDAAPAELAACAKRDPGIVAKLVEMSNSPLSGLSAPVASLEQALMVLGREMLYRWLSLGLYRSNGAARDEMLLEIALRRARFLELVASSNQPKQACDELFLVGMFSVFDSLLGMPLPKVTEKIHMPQAVVEALLKSDGPYARYLTLALAVEKGRNEQVQRIADATSLPMERVIQCASEASAWAEDALQSS